MVSFLYHKTVVTETKFAAPGRRILGCQWPSGRQFAWAIVFGISLAAGTALLKHIAMPPPIRYLVIVTPMVFGFLYMRAMVSDIRRQMDELQLRIYLEAAAVVVCGLFIVALVYPLLQAARLVGPLDYLEVLILIVALGFIGYMTAVRRYR